MAKKNPPHLSQHSFVEQAINLIQASRQQAVRQTNSLMVFTYYHLGKIILEQEQGGNKKAAYGEEIIKQLSKELTTQFGRGFSEDNLENMRLFYMLYKFKIEQSQFPRHCLGNL